ncbi:MAG: class I tRNA ligase family protein, partial [Patescibacteria group bacterium]
MEKSRIFLTTPIYYVNDKPHIGHAFSTLVADVLTRYFRQKGKEVFFLTGTDEHGSKIYQKSQELKKNPQQFCDEISFLFKEAWKNLGIEYDYFIRTTDKDHIETVKYILEFLKKIPFKEVYIHPTILNIEGRRMSKSLGTGIDPLDLIEKYGADATRFGIILQTNRDQQAIRFDERSILAARNFVNKLWNVARFVKMVCESKGELKANFKQLSLADRWIMSRLNTIIDSITKKIKNYEFGEAAKELYEFTWHEFADWYLEISKWQMANSEWQKNTLSILYNSLFIILKLFHPFIPFVTEQIYQNWKSPKLLMVEDWPKVNKKYINKKIEKEFEEIKELVIKIRNWKAQQKIPLNQIVDYKLDKDITEKALVEKIAKVRLI